MVRRRSGIRVHMITIIIAYISMYDPYGYFSKNGHDGTDAHAHGHDYNII